MSHSTKGSTEPKPTAFEDFPDRFVDSDEEDLEIEVSPRARMNDMKKMSITALARKKHTRLTRLTKRSLIEADRESERHFNESTKKSESSFGNLSREKSVKSMSKDASMKSLSRNPSIARSAGGSSFTLTGTRQIRSKAARKCTLREVDEEQQQKAKELFDSVDDGNGNAVSNSTAPRRKKLTEADQVKKLSMLNSALSMHHIKISVKQVSSNENPLRDLGEKLQVEEPENSWLAASLKRRKKTTQKRDPSKRTLKSMIRTNSVGDGVSADEKAAEKNI